MGDLSQVMPILHPYIGGARGTGHGADFAIVDKPLAYLGPAKALAAMVVDMLWDGAAGAREVDGQGEAADDARELSRVPAWSGAARDLRRVGPAPARPDQRIGFGKLLTASSPICLPIALPTSVELR